MISRKTRRTYTFLTILCSILLATLCRAASVELPSLKPNCRLFDVEVLLHVPKQYSLLEFEQLQKNGATIKTRRSVPSVLSPAHFKRNPPRDGVDTGVENGRN